jgi:hypothetical protein
VNRLHCHSLAHRIFFTSSVPLQPVIYAKFQRRKYAIQLFDQFAKGSFQEYIRSRTPGNFLETHEQELDRRITDAITRGQPLVSAILDGAVEYVNTWKNRFNTDNPQTPQGACAADKTHDYPFCQFFAEAVTEMTFAFVIHHLSACPLPITSDTRQTIEQQQDSLKQVLRESSIHWPFVGFTREEIEADSELGEILPRYAEERFILIKAEQVSKEAFLAGDIKWGAGQHLLLVLEIEGILRPIMTSDLVTDIIQEDEAWQRKLIVALFGGEEPIYFRGCLRQCLGLLRIFMREIRSPLLEKDIHALANLRSWFDCKVE